MTNQKLIKKVLEREKAEGRSWPNNLGGREIDKIFGRELNPEEWLDFNLGYEEVAPKKLLHPALRR